MNRKEYLELQKKKHGRKVVGVFPALFPREILLAAGCVPAEIWDPPMEIGQANAHLQTYVCSVVKLGLELVLSPKAEMVEAYLFPHTCDSIQNLASVVFDYCRIDTPCLFFYHPKAPYSTGARQYYAEQLQALADGLAKLFGPRQPGALKIAVDVCQEMYGRLADLYARRARGALALNNKEFYALLRQGEYLLPDDFTPLLDEALAKPAPSNQPSGPSVILSGVLPNPPGILSQLDELGVPVVHDDLLMGSRRIPAKLPSEGDPLDRMVESYFSLPPCSTRTNSIAERRDYLLGLIEKSGAKGMIFYMVKFCEPEYFDLPQIVAELKERGVPSLVLDVEPNSAYGGQTATRVEAFIEMIG